MIKLNYILQNVHIQHINNVLFIIHKSYYNQQYYLIQPELPTLND